MFKTARLDSLYRELASLDPFPGCDPETRAYSVLRRVAEIKSEIKEIEEINDD